MGMSLRAYSRHRRARGLVGQSLWSVQQAVRRGWIELEPDGSIDPRRADLTWAQLHKPRVRIDGTATTAVPTTPVELELSGDDLDGLLKSWDALVGSVDKLVGLAHTALRETARHCEYETTVWPRFSDHVKTLPATIDAVKRRLVGLVGFINQVDGAKVLIRVPQPEHELGKQEDTQ